MYKVKIQLRDKSIAVYVNDEEVCTADRQDRAAYKKAIVYAADPYVYAYMCDVPFEAFVTVVAVEENVVANSWTLYQ